MSMETYTRLLIDAKPEFPIHFLNIYSIRYLYGKEAPQMASVRCTDVQARPREFLDVTSVTLDELQTLVPPREAAAKRGVF